MSQFLKLDLDRFTGTQQIFKKVNLMLKTRTPTKVWTVPGRMDTGGFPEGSWPSPLALLTCTWLLCICTNPTGFSLLQRIHPVLVFLPLYFFNWRIIALPNFVVFCQTSTRVSHKYTMPLPSRNFLPSSSPSHPSRLSQSPCLSSLSHKESARSLSP